MTQHTTFEELYARLRQLYHEEQYAAALELAEAGLRQFPLERTFLDYWRITLAAKSGDAAAAKAFFAEALDQGSWFSDVLLMRSAALAGLQDDPEFAALIARDLELAESDQARQFPLYMLRPEGKCQSGGPACPLLIGLHASGGTAQTSLDFWKPAASLGWLVAAPQSSQALMKGAYVWDNREVAEKEIRKDYETLTESYSINPWQTVLAGHSLGGETAIWLTLRGALENSYFLAIGPTGPLMDDPGAWKNLLQERPLNGLRGYILQGELDEAVSAESIAALVETLNLAGVETELEIVPGVEHDFQPGYEEAIRRGLNFLVS